MSMQIQKKSTFKYDCYFGNKYAVFLVSSPRFLLQHVIQNPIILSVLEVPL